MSTTITVWTCGLFDVDRVNHGNGDESFEILCCMGSARWECGEKPTLKEAQDAVRQHNQWTRRQKSIKGAYTAEYKEKLKEEKAQDESDCVCSDRDR